MQPMRLVPPTLLLLTVSARLPAAQLSNELHPSWSPSGEYLVFESNRYGNADIFVSALESGDVRRITSDPSDDSRPVWSPDGAWIAFHSTRSGNADIYRVHPDGTDWSRLTVSERDETNAAWSPTSDAIVYEIRGDDHWYLGVLNVADGSDRILLDRPGDHLTPTWPSAGEVIFSYSPPGGNHDTDIELVTVDLRGRVTGTLLGGARGNSNVNYSTKRRLFVFNSIRDGNWEVYTAARDGANLSRLTVQSGPGLAGIDGQPEWSPDGSLVAITSGRAGSLDIVLIDPDGAEIRNLTAEWRIDTSQPTPPSR